MASGDHKALREFREQLGMTQAAFGELMGAKPASVSHWETGRRPLPAHIARRLDGIRRELEASPGEGGDSGRPRTVVIGEVRMSDGQLSPFPWDAPIVTVPSPPTDTVRDMRAVILRDEGDNVEINGWIAFFELSHRLQKNGLSIIKLADGQSFCGFLRDQDDGLAVESFFGKLRATGVEVDSCYPVLWMKAPEGETENSGDEEAEADPAASPRQSNSASISS